MDETTQQIPAWVGGKLVPVGKLEAHLEGLQHKAVSVFVMAGEQLLIQQRALSKYHTPGLWANTCCTHPHWGEPAADCADRRLQEELGLSGLDLQHRGQVHYRADVGGGMVEDEVVEVYLARTPQDIPLAPNPREVMGTRWVSLQELQAEIAAAPESFTPWLKIYLEQHCAMILGRGPNVQA